MHFFIEPYDEEIFTSTISRYFFYFGTKNKMETFRDLFGLTMKSPCFLLPSNLEFFSMHFNCKQGYTSDFFINKHTNLPIFYPFISETAKQEVLSHMKLRKGRGLYQRLGLDRQLTSTQELKYCPLCVQNDIKRFGEAYFHRVHQITGVYICTIHGCLLKTYNIYASGQQDIYSIRLNSNKIDLYSEYEQNKSLEYNLRTISEAMIFLLKSNKPYSWETTELKLKMLIDQRYEGYKSDTITLKITEDFEAYYGEETIKKIGKNLKGRPINKIINSCINKEFRMINPIWYVMFINLMFGSVKDFFQWEAQE